MTSESGAPGPSFPLLEVESSYGGVYAGTSFELSPEVADHFNRAAGRANQLLPGEYVSFEPGTYFSVSCPMATSYPRREFLAAYHQLRVRLDASIEIRLADYPRLFSNSTSDWERFRAVPTYIPKSELPSDFFGEEHQVELFQEDTLLFGPAKRFFHTARSGCLYSHIEDGPGKLVLEVTGNLDALAATGMVVFFTDPSFGEPIGVAQVNEDRSTIPLRYILLGKDHVGDVMLFNEGLVRGICVQEPRVVLELYFAQRGSGLAAALYGGHTRDTAFRTDAMVL